MENGQAFASYLTKEVWDDLVLRGWAGPPRDPALHWIRNPPGVMSPTRPVWLGPDQLVYRDQLFRRFKGFLNYGSPYLRPQFADLVADWLVTGESFPPLPVGNKRWYDARSGTYRRRLAWSRVQRVLAFLVLAALGTMTAAGPRDLLVTVLGKAGEWLVATWYAIWNVLLLLRDEFIPSLLCFALSCAAVVLTIGLLARVFFRDVSKPDPETE